MFCCGSYPLVISENHTYFHSVCATLGHNPTTTNMELIAPENRIVVCICGLSGVLLKFGKGNRKVHGRIQKGPLLAFMSLPQLLEQVYRRNSGWLTL